MMEILPLGIQAQGGNGEELPESVTVFTGVPG